MAAVLTAVVLAQVLRGPADVESVPVATGGTASPTDISSSATPGATPGATPSVTASVTASPSPSTSRTPGPPKPTSRSDFPGPDNTGVPDGVRLAPYRGPCTITRDNTVIDAKVVDCGLLIKARNVVIKRSKVNGTVAVDGRDYSARIEDSEVDGGRAQLAAVAYENLTILRSDIHGGQTSVNCYSNCLIQDSWLHGQHLPAGADWHLDAFLSNGGRDIKLIHNTLSCDPPHNSSGGGCTAAAAVFGDFGPNSNYLFDNNLFVASTEMSYCFYGGVDRHKPYGTQADNIVVVNNVFQRGRNGKCGYHGPVTSFDPSKPGNVWRDNVWDDGKPVQSSL